jgi:nucleoside-diphosphate-sugar epimerase
MLSPTSALPEGSLILLTGATGFVSAHIIQQLLRRGYRVRGTVRNLSKAEWLANELFREEASEGAFELVLVEDMAVDNAFDEAMHGVAGVVHVASDVTWDGDPNKVIPPTLAGVKNALLAATKEKSVKRFVYTSSLAAAGMPLPNTKWHVDKNSWNDLAIQLAWAPPPYDGRGPLSYSAAKTEAEKTVWKFVDEEKRNFAVNTILPYVFIGPVLHEKHNPSTASLIFAIDNGATSFHLDPQASKLNAQLEEDSAVVADNVYFCLVAFIDIVDVANLHVAALLDPTVENERIHAWSETNTWSAFLAGFRSIRPEKTFPGLPEETTMLGTVDNRLGKDLLKKWTGQNDWTGVQESIKNTLEGRRPTQLTLGYSY